MCPTRLVIIDMSESVFTQCLNTDQPRVIELPREILIPPNSVTPGLDLFGRALGEADMQATEIDPDSESQATICYFDQQDPASLNRFKAAISGGRLEHGSPAQIDYRDDGGTLRSNADWAWRICTKYFSAGLNRLHLFGSYVRATNVDEL
jgi:hypothetical protein